MMKFNKTLVLVVLTFHQLFIFSQNTKPIATINNIFDGNITQKDLLKCKKIKINYTSGYKIIGYSIWDFLNPHQNFVENKNKFTKRTYNLFKEKHRLIVFYNILAVNKRKDTIILNPITLQITKENSSKQNIPKISEYADLKGVSHGSILKKWFLSEQKLNLNDNNYKINSFLTNARLKCENCTNKKSDNEHFSLRQRQMVLQSRINRDFIIIYKIKAIDENNKRIDIPPLFFKLK